MNLRFHTDPSVFYDQSGNLYPEPKETLEDPTKFELYRLDAQNKVMVYPPEKEKVKTVGRK